jgi:hypothetical protein
VSLAISTFAAPAHPVGEISNSNHFRRPTATFLQLASCATPRRCSAFNFSTSHCALHPRPHISRYGQAAACPRAATQTYRSLRFPTVAALVPSAGSTTLQIELRSDAGAVSPGIRCGARALRGSRRTHRKAKTMEVPSILQGPWRLADWIDGIS